MKSLSLTLVAALVALAATSASAGNGDLPPGAFGPPCPPEICKNAGTPSDNENTSLATTGVAAELNAAAIVTAMGQQVVPVPRAKPELTKAASGEPVAAANHAAGTKNPPATAPLTSNPSGFASPTNLTQLASVVAGGLGAGDETEGGSNDKKGEQLRFASARPDAAVESKISGVKGNAQTMLSQGCEFRGNCAVLGAGAVRSLVEDATVSGDRGTTIRQAALDDKLVPAPSRVVAQ